MPKATMACCMGTVSSSLSLCNVCTSFFNSPKGIPHLNILDLPNIVPNRQQQYLKANQHYSIIPIAVCYILVKM